MLVLPTAHQRSIKGRIDTLPVSTVRNIETHIGVSNLADLIIQYWHRDRKDLALGHRQPDSVRNYAAKLYNQVEIPVQAFQEVDAWTYHRVRSTAGERFRNYDPRQDWVWVRTGAKSMYGILQGHLPGRIRAIFKLRLPDDTEPQRLALVRMTQVEAAGRPDKSHDLVTVKERLQTDPSREWVINIRALVAMAHVVQDANRSGRWYVNTRIDLWTWNQFYK